MYKIEAVSPFWLVSFNNYYDHDYHCDRTIFATEEEYQNLVAEVHHFNNSIAHGQAIKLIGGEG